MKIKGCCMNCSNYWADSTYGYCTIDKQEIDAEIAEIVKCRAFSLWWGAV